MSMIPNAHITIYNKYVESHTEKYQRAVIYNCVWQSTRGIRTMKQQTQENSALILIPFASDTGYQEPKAWQVDRDGWTLQEGDVIVRGMINQEITTEYQVSNLRADHEYVFVISSVDSMDEGSPAVQHWELQAK